MDFFKGLQCPDVFAVGIVASFRPATFDQTVPGFAASIIECRKGVADRCTGWQGEQRFVDSAIGPEGEAIGRYAVRARSSQAGCSSRRRSSLRSISAPEAATGFLVVSTTLSTARGAATWAERVAGAFASLATASREMPSRSATSVTYNSRVSGSLAARTVGEKTVQGFTGAMNVCKPATLFQQLQLALDYVGASAE